MKKVTNHLILLLTAFFVSNFVQAQTLSPQELQQINSNSDFAFVSVSLVNKGYKLQSQQVDEQKKEVAKWYFQPSPFSGENVSAYLIKSVDSKQKSKTTFFLYNPFHYKDFVNCLTIAKYKYKGVQIIGNSSYSVFKNKRATLTTRETKTLNNQTCFEINIEAD